MNEAESKSNLLEQVVQQYCQSAPGMNLAIEQSHSYSHWLIQQKY